MEETSYHQLEPEIYRKIVEEIGEANLILDIGCGEGKLANFLGATLDKEVRGIDISNTKLIKARESTEEQGISQLVQFMEGDASHMDNIANKSFGAIVSVYTLHELDDPNKALKEVERVLGAGGKLVLVDFIKGGEAEKLWRERYYMPQEIGSMLREAGFGEVTTEFVHDDVVFVSSLKI